jgi:aspartyl-tRNA(Asn)/glutamyl-tRNA(Gln) amidotransferase subunit A
VFGFKQSLGVIPHSQASDAFSNYTYVTPMTRTAADTALMLEVMAGEDACDPWSIGFHSDTFTELSGGNPSIRGKKFGFARAPKGRPIAVAVSTAFDSALNILQEQGAIVEEVGDIDLDVESIWRVINHTSWRARFTRVAQEHGDVLTPSMLQQLKLVRDVTANEYQDAMFARTVLYRRVAELFRRFDFLVTPTLNQTALPIDQDLFGELEIDGVHYAEVRPNWFPWTMPFNLTGNPAVSIPCGWSPDGLPIGLQMVGRFKDDAQLLRAAHCFEQACGAGRSPLEAGKF